MGNDNLLDLAFERFDAANSADPRVWRSGGLEYAREQFFAERLTEWVLKLSPAASQSLLLASRCQHICRWEIPRNTYSMDRVGYLKWRSELKQFHAQKAGEILEEIGFDDETVVQVRDLNLKKNLNKDPECQTLEDALCLVFMEHQFDDLIEVTEEAKMIKIVQKTWAKMSKRAHAEALKLDLSSPALEIVAKALM